MRLVLPLALALAVGCREPAPQPEPVDHDGDGVTADEDCNDDDATAYPGAEERCDGVDNDCDGDIDEDPVDARTFYADADDDGHGDPDDAVDACDAPEGYVTTDDDCDDDAPSVRPGADEVCNGVDDDCDGEVDEGDAAPPTWYADVDADGFGDDETTVEACEAPDASWVEQPGDCDDTDDAFFPGAPEDDCTDPNDYNCDGSVGYADADADGFAACEDCDDTAAAVNPDATEVCNGVDDDCDDEIDEGDAAPTVFYADDDGDTFGDPTAVALACALPDGHVTNADDCDDTNAAVNPDATEVCNGIDDDCDEGIDEGDATPTLFYADDDGDTFGDPHDVQFACTQPDGHVTNAYDCDDGDPDVHFGATEVCNGIDDDCDTEIDEAGATGEVTFYADDDGDTFGDPGVTRQACDAPDGFVANDDDCDDANGDAYPDAPLACDGSDLDCDGLVDNDADADGFADLTCGGDDCRDDDPLLYPDAQGRCADAGSCADLLDTPADAGDGVYLLDPDGPDGDGAPFEALCDLSGGGWTLLLKSDGSTTLQWDSALWTDDETLNAGDLTELAADAKFTAFSELPVNELRGCFPTQTTACFDYPLSEPGTARAAFAAGPDHYNSHMGLFPSVWSTQPNCHQFGVNVNNAGGNKVRFGFTANQENDCLTNDTRAGLGLYSSYGAGSICTSTECSKGNTNRSFPGYLWGR